MKRKRMASAAFLLATLLLGASQTQAAPATISTFTGGDPGEGLDLQGNFIYAFAVGATTVPGRAGDANFTLDNAAGVTVTAVNQAVNWFGGVEFGDTPADDALEIVMRSIRWSPNPSKPQVRLGNVIPGATYKLQLLFGEACCNRGFDVLVNGELIADDFNPGVAHNGIGNVSENAVITYEVVPTGNTITILLDGEPVTGEFPDHNPILNGLTLEQTAAAGDSDGDGLPDTWEQLFFGNLSATATADPDNDGLTNAEELTAGSNPTLADTDSDGVNDGAEVKTHRSNPNATDSDGDGLSDGDEVNVHGTNPASVDTDGDRLGDAREINVTRTNPKAADSDNDGFDDYTEYHLVTNPLDSNNKPKRTSIGVFTGPDPGEGLDFDGTFLYAVNAGNEAEGGQIRDALFTMDNVEGVTLVASQVANGWNVGVNYGESPEEQVLSAVMSSIRWSDAGNATTADVTVTLANLEIGAAYKLQILLGERLWARGFDVSIQGKKVGREIAPFIWQGGLPARRDNGVVMTHSFVATKTDLTFNLDGRPVRDPAMPDHNAILNGFTLERVSAKADTDNDGLWDAWENEFFGNLSQTATGDPDNDGLTNANEFTADTDPTLADSDGDGLTDGEEITAGTNPALADSDSDGLSDSEEVKTYRTNATKSDTDEDGLLDGAEVLTWKTDPTKKDTDGDGREDGVEVRMGTDPLKAIPLSVFRNTVIQAFTGGDPGEGLDLQGRFKYAINVSSAGPAGKAGDADFTGDTAPGITITAANNIASWSNPDYGDSPADTVIEKVTQSIRYDTRWRVELTGLIPGSTYKLQLLFYEQCCGNRGFNVIADGVLIAEGFVPADIQGGVNPISAGAVISTEFTTQGDKLVIIGDGPAAREAFPDTISDTNAILDGITLEALNEVAPPNPPTVSIARSQANVVITFEGTLQSADSVSGPYTDVSGSSPITVTPSGTMKFYRAVRR